MKSEEINAIFTLFSKSNPDPKTELIFHNHFTLLVAVVLSAQATDISVNKATKELFEYYDTPQKMLELGVNGLENYIKSIGLYHSKAKNVIKLSEQLIRNFNSKVPNNLADLMSLAGVGQKTANVVLNCAFGKAVMPVDTHVFRVARRIGFTDAKNPAKVEEDLMRVIPAKWLNTTLSQVKLDNGFQGEDAQRTLGVREHIGDPPNSLGSFKNGTGYNAHHWLILHGRYVCKARKPLCESCIINKYCKFYKNNIINDNA